jgi:prolyl oligopeptidase
MSQKVVSYSLRTVGLSALLVSFVAISCGKQTLPAGKKTSAVAEPQKKQEPVAPLVQEQSFPWEVSAYPAAKTGTQKDLFFGKEVHDPYRWMEDNKEPDLMPWIKSQNALVRERLDISMREKFHKEIATLIDVDSISTFRQAGGSFYFFKRKKGEDKSKIYKGSSLQDENAKVLVDPKNLGIEGNVSLGGLNVSEDGKHLGFTVSINGSDEKQIRILNTETGTLLPDSVTVKFATVVWTKTGNGFYYVTDSNSVSPSEKAGRLYFHALGTEQVADKLILEGTQNDRSLDIALSKDKNILFVSEWEGWSKAGIVALSTEDWSKRVEVLPFGEGGSSIVGSAENRVYISTNRDASNGKLIEVQFDLNQNSSQLRELISEQNVPTETMVVDGKIYIKQLVDVVAKLNVASVDSPLKWEEVALPALGDFYFDESIGKDKESRPTLRFESYTFPSTIYSLESTDQKTILNPVFQPKLDVDLSDVEIKQEFFKSKDGTRVPMFIVQLKGAQRNGTSPTILYSYGGFASSETPSWYFSYMLPWVKQGGTFVVANIRGGLEYGESWHQAGMLLNKQNVFDDFIAAGESLIAQKVTSSQKLGIYGISNGGLLVGAALNQRPDLFGAGVPAVGVMDMLRFPLFTAGKHWVTEYGSPENEKDFLNLLSYSPVHNIKPGVQYPATMVMTGASDERVVPMHSYKYAAALQKAQAGKEPILIRIETEAGHGAGGGSFSKRVDNNADVLTFFHRALSEKSASKAQP